MNVVLLGDSIRMGYQARAKYYLGETVNVYAPEENCRWSGFTLNCLNSWFGTFPSDIDVVHWNNGIWDAIESPEGGRSYSTVEIYMDYMSRILKYLRNRNVKKIIFATTTPVTIPYANTNINMFNSVIKDFMQKESITINDLNALVNANLSKYITEDKVHLTEDGYDACGKAVADICLKYST